MRYTTNATRMCIVREQLQRGLGVEDIAVKSDLHVDQVREDFTTLRLEGAFKHMFPQRAQRGPKKAKPGLRG